MNVAFIAWLTLREASRRKLLWIGTVLALAFLLLFGVAFYVLFEQFTRQIRPSFARMAEGASFFIIAGLYAVNFLVTMLSVLASVDTISGEIASHSIQSIVTKPLRRWEVLLGKWFGFAALISAAVLLLGGGIIAIGWAISGYVVPNAAAGLALLVLQGLVLLSLTLFGGTRFSTLTNGVFVFMLFGLAFLGGWTEQFGAFLQNETAVRIGILSSLALPTEALWRRAAFLMQPPLFQSFGSTPFAVASLPSPAMVVYAVGYGVAMVGLAVRSFSRRDL
ncbi:MAG: ABC transporter permease subunit [Anaerolineae bacterium]